MRSLKSTWLLILLITAMLPAQSLAQGNARRGASLDKILQNAKDLPAKTRVIIRYRRGATSQAQQRLVSRGGRVLAEHRGIGAVTVELPSAAIAHMAADPDVLGMSADTLMGTAQTNEPVANDPAPAESTTTTEPAPGEPSTASGE